MSKRLAPRLNVVYAPLFVALVASCGGEGEFGDEEAVAESAQTIQYNGHDYIFVTTAKPWPQARQHCEDIGYGLVTINNASEEVFLSQYKGSTSWWIGHNDIAVEGT